MTRIQIYHASARQRINRAVKTVEANPPASVQPRENVFERAGLPIKKLRIRNDTGADLQRGDVVEFQRAVFDPDNDLSGFVEWVAVRAVVPTASASGRWGLVGTFIAQDDVGTISIDGVKIARVNRVSLAHEWASPTPGETYLTSDTVGECRIVDALNVTGIVEAYVDLNQGSAEGNYTATFKSDGLFSIGTEYRGVAYGAVTHPRLTLDVNGDIVVADGGFFTISFNGTVSSPLSEAGLIPVPSEADQYTVEFTLNVYKKDAAPGQNYVFLGRAFTELLMVVDPDRPAVVQSSGQRLQWVTTKSETFSLQVASEFAPGQTIAFETVSDIVGRIDESEIVVSSIL